jgi:uncharacterized protein YidB (DUF937 family)
MARLLKTTCDICGEQKDMWHGAGQSPPTTCEQCVSGLEEKALQKHLAEMAALSTEEQFQRIHEALWRLGKVSYEPSRQIIGDRY